MTIQQTYQAFQDKQKQNILLTTALLLLMFATLGIDYLFAQFQNSSFYFSESLLFSSYWILFLPLLNFQWKLVKRTQKIQFRLLIVGLAVSTHLLVYPALVWLLSKSFSNHTFPYRQTFDYGLTAYSIITFIIYFLFLFISAIYQSKVPSDAMLIQEKKVPENHFITSILISDNNNKKTSIATNDILYFSANSPYINIHHLSKKYLHHETLKSLESKLNNHQFIRIHKTYIVNIYSVVSYQSRLNGDYDLTLTDDTILRVSRNYAANFKSRFADCHRFASK